MSHEDHRRVIAIDGPAAAGKTTVAQVLADRLGAMLFDTGTLYRAVTLGALNAGVAPSAGVELAQLANARHIDVTAPSSSDGRLYDVRLDGHDVTWEIRDPRVEAHVSEVAAHQAVRDALLPIQRRIAANGKVVMVGRDIGSVVVPGAGLKIFLQAGLAERARRRYAELVARGVDIAIDDIEAELSTRDDLDTTRTAAPLRVATGAEVIDTDGRSIPEIVNEIEVLARQIWNRSSPPDSAERAPA